MKAPAAAAAAALLMMEVSYRLALAIFQQERDAVRMLPLLGLRMQLKLCFQQTERSMKKLLLRVQTGAPTQTGESASAVLRGDGQVKLLILLLLLFFSRNCATKAKHHLSHLRMQRILLLCFRHTNK